MLTFLVAAFLLAHPSRTELRITVYDKARIDSRVTTAAWAEVQRIFRTAEIDVVWVPGQLDAREATLVTYPETPRKEKEIEATCRARADIALDLLPRAPKPLRNKIIGLAIPLATEGLNVLLFVDRIAATADQVGKSYSTYLAHTLAHEIGHVLLRSNEHSVSGIMSSRWTNHEYSRMSIGALLFDRKEAERMRATLTRTNCQALTAAGR